MKEHTGTVVIEDMAEQVKKTWHKGLPADPAGNYTPPPADDCGTNRDEYPVEQGTTWLT